MSKKNIFPILIFCFFFANFISQQAQIADTTQLNNSIAKGIDYLNNRIAGDSIYYLGVPMLIPIAEYYHLSIDSRIYHTEKRIIDPIEKLLFRRYSYMFGHMNQDSEIFQDLSTIDIINLYPTYGEKICSMDKFFHLLDSASTTSSYELSHAYFALLAMKSTMQEKSMITYDRKLQKKMKSVLSKSNKDSFTDIEIEILAMSLYGGINVSEKRVLQLMNQQSPDGSWQQKGNTSSLLRDHSTILAIWALIERRFMDDNTLYLSRYRKY